MLLLSPLAWAAGSVFSRGAAVPKRPLVATAMQMLCGGALALVVSAFLGEPQQLELAKVSANSLLALGYLVVFGSLLAYSAYVWLLRSAPLSLVSTYAYVNPVVAVALGWAFLDEPLTPMTLGAAGIIVAAVVLMVTGSPPKPATAPGSGELEPGPVGSVDEAA